MQKVRLTIKGLSYSERQTGAYALLLAEEGGERKLPIVIGGFEAQSIAIALEKAVSPPRPLTHDLFKNVLGTFHVTILEVVIHKIKDGVFFASIIADNNGQQEVIDARPSDAVALAVRFKCPIYTTEDVLNQAGLILDEEQSSKPNVMSTQETDEPPVEAERNEPASPLHKATLKELNAMMKKAVASEDYELAARIRDEIDKRHTK
jgi:bifunctional DNase/RNase